MISPLLVQIGASIHTAHAKYHTYYDDAESWQSSYNHLVGLNPSFNIIEIYSVVIDMLLRETKRTEILNYLMYELVDKLVISLLSLPDSHILIYTLLKPYENLTSQIVNSIMNNIKMMNNLPDIDNPTMDRYVEHKLKSLTELLGYTYSMSQEAKNIIDKEETTDRISYRKLSRYNDFTINCSIFNIKVISYLIDDISSSINYESGIAMSYFNSLFTYILSAKSKYNNNAINDIKTAMNRITKLFTIEQLTEYASTDNAYSTIARNIIAMTETYEDDTLSDYQSDTL